MQKSELVRQELEMVRRQNGGFLKPEDVVDFARNKKTALHSQFQWDDTLAAEQYRLQQARQIIRVVVIINENTHEPTRAFVNLRGDRKDGNGYRAVVDVMGNPDLFTMLLADAKKELNYFSKKYSTLREIAELSGVFNAIDQVLEEPKPRKKGARQAAA